MGTLASVVCDFMSHPISRASSALAKGALFAHYRKVMRAGKCYFAQVCAKGAGADLAFLPRQDKMPVYEIINKY